jgi:hypothetical protein
MQQLPVYIISSTPCLSKTPLYSSHILLGSSRTSNSLASPTRKASFTMHLSSPIHRNQHSLAIASSHLDSFFALSHQPLSFLAPVGTSFLPPHFHFVFISFLVIPLLTQHLPYPTLLSPYPLRILNMCALSCVSVPSFLPMFS